MPLQETFDHGSERFKKTAKKLTDTVDDHEKRITKLEKGGGGELEFTGCENGVETIWWVRARRDWSIAAP